MTLAHLHLLLNHVPTIGTAIAIALLILTLVRKHDALRRVSLELFCLVALITLPAYLSGVGAQQRMIEGRPEISQILIARHHDAAVIASMFMVLTGLVAWIGLWQFRRLARQPRGNTAAVLLLSVVTMVLMARAATMGGEIRHPEILSDIAAEAAEEPAIAPAWVSAESIKTMVTDRTWLWPACEALHFIGLWLLFGIVLLINLRLLGLMKGASFAALHRLLPWAILGLAINLITGMLFVIAAPEMYATNISFYWKMGFLIVAGVNLLYFTVFDGPWEVGARDDAPLRVKAMSASAIALWVGVMYFGRMLPFLGNSF
jgi:uncharacterized membrane protein